MKAIYQKAIHTRSKLKKQNKSKSFQGKCIGIQETKKPMCVVTQKIFEKAFKKHHEKRNKQ